MRYLFAPNHTLASYTTVVQPFFNFLEENDIKLSSPPNDTAHTTFHSAYQAKWLAGRELSRLIGKLFAPRLVPRVNFDKKYDETYALIKEHVTLDKHFLGYHNAPVAYANTDNAVKPA
jgi:hypothetical protein